MAKASKMGFDLPPEDVAYLEACGLEWETVVEGGLRMLVLHNYPLPHPYTPPLVTLHLRIPSNYDSGAPLDMFYTSPLVTREDKQAIPAFTDAGVYAGRQWNQWSRHRTIQPWRPGEDSIATHLAHVAWILKEEAAGRTW